MLAKVLGADVETESHLHWQFPWIWQSLWRSFLASLYVNTSPFRNKMGLLREGTSAVLLQSGLDEKMVGGFHGTLLLSAKHTRSLVWLENTLRTAIRRTIQRINNSVWFDGRISPISAKDLSRRHQLGKIVLPRIFLGYVRRGENLEGDIMVADIEELERWTHLNSTPEGSMLRKC